MSEPRDAGRMGGATPQDSLRSARAAVARNPATERLMNELGGYLGAQARRAVAGAGGRVGDLTRQLTDVAEGRMGATGLLGRTARGVAQGESAGKAATKAGLRGLTGKVRSLFGGGHGRSRSGGKFVTITEDVDVGVPVNVAYDQWTRFTDFPRFGKGIQKVGQEEPHRTDWNAKVGFSSRSWTSTITEQVPDDRIVWRSEASKGVMNGAVTFHPLADNLTRILVSLQYYPRGLFEKTGNLWRAQGRRVRLDLKLFRRFVTMGEADGAGDGWRGEIHDGRVTRDHAEDGGGDGQDERDERGRQEERDDGAAEADGRRGARSRARDTDDSAGDEYDDVEDEYDDGAEAEYEDEEEQSDEDTGAGRREPVGGGRRRRR